MKKIFELDELRAIKRMNNYKSILICLYAWTCQWSAKKLQEKEAKKRKGFIYWRLILTFLWLILTVLECELLLKNESSDKI